MDEVTDGVDGGGDLLLGHSFWPGAASGRGAQAGLGDQLAGLGLGDPLADDGGVRSGVQCRPVLGELLVARADLFPQDGQFARDGLLLAGGKVFDRGGQPGGVE